jgi:hypothetical protein
LTFEGGQHRDVATLQLRSHAGLESAEAEDAVEVEALRRNGGVSII